MQKCRQEPITPKRKGITHRGGKRKRKRERKNEKKKREKEKGKERTKKRRKEKGKKETTTSIALRYKIFDRKRDAPRRRDRNGREEFGRVRCGCRIDGEVRPKRIARHRRRAISSFVYGYWRGRLRSAGAAQKVARGPVAYVQRKHTYTRQVYTRGREREREKERERGREGGRKRGPRHVAATRRKLLLF